MHGNIKSAFQKKGAPANLIIFCMNFEISLWMCTHRTDLRCFFTYHNMSAIAAFPNLHFTLCKNFLHLYIMKKSTISFLMLLLNGTDQPELCSQLRKPFFLCCLSLLSKQSRYICFLPGIPLQMPPADFFRSVFPHTYLL